MQKKLTSRVSLVTLLKSYKELKPMIDLEGIRYLLTDSAEQYIT